MMAGQLPFRRLKRRDYWGTQHRWDYPEQAVWWYHVDLNYVLRTSYTMWLDSVHMRVERLVVARLAISRTVILGHP